MSRYKLIALDMDGTLLKSDKTLDPDTIRDLAKAAEQGIQAVYCSGRGIMELADYVKKLLCMRYAVCMSGALVYDLQEEKTIFSQAIAGEYVREIVKTAARYDAMVHFMTEKESIARKDQVMHMADFHMGVYQPMFWKVAKGVEDMETEIRRHGEIPKVNVFFRSAQDRQEAYEALRHLPLYFAFSEETSLEMNAAGVTKESGLRALADYLGVAMADTVGIGDADNDRAMLEAVGLSVAMGNAAEDIKVLCDVVTADNDHNGVGQAIRKYCLTGELA